jgi:hypothetical protein
MPSELIVLSHLRWDWVWQRPQQIVSRIAASGFDRVWFVEEPLNTADMEGADTLLVTKPQDGVTRAWLQIPSTSPTAWSPTTPASSANCSAHRTANGSSGSIPRWLSR